MARAALVAVNSFSQFGNEYAAGAEIPAEHYQKWPDETLPNRLNGGDVKWGNSNEPLTTERAKAIGAILTTAPIADTTPPEEIGTVELTDQERAILEQKKAEDTATATARKAIEEDTAITPTQRKAKLKKFDAEHAPAPATVETTPEDDGLNLP